MEKVKSFITNFRHLKKGTQVLSLVIVMLALPAVIVLAQQVTKLLSQASGSATLSLVPQNATMPPDKSFSLQLNSSVPVAFVQVEITFDPNKIKLANTGTAIVTNSGFQRKVIVTDKTTANSAGRITLALGVDPGAAPLSGAFEIANLPFTTVSTTPNDSVQIGSANVLVADDGANPVTVSSVAASIVLNPVTATATPVATVSPSPVPTPTRTPTPTPTRTATPTPQPTSAPGSSTGSANPIEDTYVDAGSTSTAHNSDDTLYVDGDPNKVTYMLFDLTSYNSTSLSSAALSFRTTSGQYSGSPDKVQVFLVNSTSWPENITYSNRPAVSGIKLGEVSASNSDTVYTVTLDPSIVKAYLGGRLALAVVPTGGDALYFYSRESSVYKPKLQLGGLSSGGSSISIFAAGQPNDGIYPNMELLINGVVVKTFTGVTGNPTNRTFLEYKYSSPTKVAANQVRVNFTNDARDSGGDRNLVVDRINIDGVDYQSEAPNVYGTGVWTKSTGCTTGNLSTEWLYCNGYFQY